MNKIQGALTSTTDWNKYHTANKLDQDLPEYLRFILEKEILSQKPGTIFELGCGGSVILIECARSGWKVSGIDFHTGSIDCLHRNLSIWRNSVGYLINDDVFTFDCTTLKETYNLLVSFGFLEHFQHPEDILRKWASVLKHGGRVISAIPNLYSLNARLMKKLSCSLWDKHEPITAMRLDQIHIDADLLILKPATYAGRYDLDMLIPWDKIRELSCSILTFKCLRYFGSYVVSPLLNTLFSYKKRLVSPIIYGVYIKD